MGVWDFWTTKSRNYVYGMLDESQCSGNIRCLPLEADEHYVVVLLRRMRIVNVRTGFKRFYGAVHADVGAQHATGKVVSFTQVIAPPELRDVSPENLDRTIITNQALFGPTPYRGGPLKLNAALLSVQSADLLGPYLEVLTDLASLAGVAYVAAAKPFLDPLRRGVDLLTGTTGPQSLEIYLVTNVTSPMTGAYVVVRAPDTEVRLRDLRLAADFSLSHAGGMDLSDYPHMVFTLEASTSRPDWRGIPELGPAYDEFIEALKTDEPPAIEEALTVLRRTILLSDDLLSQHAKTLVAQIEAKRDMLQEGVLTAKGRDVRLPTLDEFDPFSSAA